MTDQEMHLLFEIQVEAQGNHCATATPSFDELDDELEALADVDVVVED